MHGEAEVTVALGERWDSLARALRYLNAVLQPDATGRWLRTPILDLGGKTPLEISKRPRGADRLVELTRSYTDPSFS